MLRRTGKTSGVIVEIVVIVVMACCGVGLGLVRVWPKMVQCFFLAVYLSECCAVLLLNQKIKSRFKKLGELITGKSIPDRLAGEFVSNSILVCMIIAVAEMTLFSMLAYNRGRWLDLCIFLAALLITNAVFSSYIIWLKIKAHTEYLEEVVSNDKASKALTETKQLGTNGVTS